MSDFSFKGPVKVWSVLVAAVMITSTAFAIEISPWPPVGVPYQSSCPPHPHPNAPQVQFNVVYTQFDSISGKPFSFYYRPAYGYQDNNGNGQVDPGELCNFLGSSNGILHGYGWYHDIVIPPLQRIDQDGDGQIDAESQFLGYGVNHLGEPAYQYRGISPFGSPFNYDDIEELEHAPVFHGRQWYRDPTTGTGLERFFLNGFIHGPDRTYHSYPDVMAMETNYFHGQPHGPHREWDPAGNLTRLGQYGGAAYYDTNGDLESVIHYQPCGEWLSYAPDGTISSVTSYPPCIDASVAPPPHDDAQPPLHPTDPYIPDEQVEIRGYVRDSMTGAPIVGAMVDLGGSTMVGTNGEGFYQVLSEHLTQTSLSCTHSSYHSVTKVVEFENRSHLTQDIRLVENKGLNAPVVTGLTSEYGNFFLAPPSVANNYLVSVDWNGAPIGDLEFTINGGMPMTLPANALGGTKTYDMGVDLPPNLTLAGNVLTVRAVNGDGLASEPVTFSPRVVPIPEWLREFEPLTIEFGDKMYTYKLEKSWPEEPLKILVDEATLGPALWAAWGLFPVIGGREFGIPPTQFSFLGESTSTGSHKVVMTGTAGFKAGPGEIGVKIGGEGRLVDDKVSGRGLLFDGADVILGIEGKIEQKDVGIVTLVPALSGSVNLPVFGRAIRYINDTAKATSVISAGGEIKVPVLDKFGALGFSSAEGTLKAGVEIKLSGGISKFKVELTTGGSNSFTWQFPANPGYLKATEFVLTAKMKMEVWVFTRTFDGSHTFTYTATPAPGGMAMAAPPSPLSVEGSAGETQTMSRDFTLARPYHRFVGNDPVAQSAGPSIAATTGTGATKVMDNVFPQSQPSIGSRDGSTTMAYVHFDPALDTLQATEIALVDHDGVNFVPPLIITDDTHADFAPDVAYDTDNQAIVAWERVAASDFTTDDPAAMAAEMEIAYSIHDPDLQSFSPPTLVTVNTRLDHSPELLSSQGDDLLLIWRSNAGNELVGTTDNPTQVHYAAWDPTHVSFDPAATVPIDFVDELFIDAAWDGTHFIVVWARDMDGDLTDASDVEIWSITHDGTGWGSATRLTNDAVTDSNPQVVYCPMGPELLWIHDEDLVRLTDWDTGAFEVIRAGSGAFDFTEFQLECSTFDDLLVTWSGADESSPSNLFAAYFDTASGTWNDDDLKLTDNAFFKPHFDTTFPNTFVPGVVFSQRDEDDNTDLWFLQLPPDYDATIPPGGVYIEPEGAVPGDTITFRVPVQNRGPIAIPGATVHMFDGDPDDGGNLMGIFPVTTHGDTFRAGETREVVIPNIPSFDNPEDHYEFWFRVVLPEFITDSVPDNNTATFFPFPPDLQVQDIRVTEVMDAQVQITATVLNAGEGASGPSAVALEIDGESGLDVLSIPNLLGQTAADVSFFVSPAHFNDLNAVLTVIADSTHMVAESDESNNRRGYGRSDFNADLINVDRDGDGIFDSWEMLQFDTLALDLSVDTDLDQSPDVIEFILGTNPGDARSVFVAGITPTTASGLVIRVEAHPGVIYYLEWSETMAPGSWTGVSEGKRMMSDTNLQFNVTRDPEDTAAFYRVRAIPDVMPLTSF